MKCVSRDNRRYKRARRACGWLICAASIVGLCWLAAARWNGVPVAPADAPLEQMPPRVPLDAALDRSKELLAALAALPPEPTWTLPPAPPGMRWAGTPSRPIYPGEAIDGEWTPETRPHLQAVINYLESQPVQDVIDRLAGIQPGGCRIPRRTQDLRRAGKLLAARARYQQAARQDVDAAIDDLFTILRLATTCCNSADYLMFLTALPCEGLAEDQMQRLAFETPLTREQAKRIIEALQTKVADERVLWQHYADIELDMLNRALDASYTVDQDGNGWLVLSRLDCVFGEPRPSAEARLGAWNMLSPLFNDRRTVAAKIERVRCALDGIDRLPFKDAWLRTGSLRDRSPFNLLDGPLSQTSMTRFAQSHYRIIVSEVATRRATIVAAALSAYRGEHGEYPSTLQYLLDDYLDAIPLDPYDDQPIRYVFKPDEDDFLLYCVWFNQIDDGGKPATRAESGPTHEPDGDLLFTHKRAAHLYSEIKLEKIEP